MNGTLTVSRRLLMHDGTQVDPLWCAKSPVVNLKTRTCLGGALVCITNLTIIPGYVFTLRTNPRLDILVKGTHVVAQTMLYVQ